MPKFRKKPVVIEAFRFLPGNSFSTANWPDWLVAAWNTPADTEKGALWYRTGVWYCGTLEGPHRVGYGDWIIQGVQGEIYACKHDIFEATYEAVDEDQGVAQSG